MEDLKELTSLSVTQEARLFVQAYKARELFKGRELTNSECILELCKKADEYDKQRVNEQSGFGGN